MGERTAIEWCDSTFNPWVGCTKVSPACDNCYAERLMETRMHKVQWGSGNLRKRTSPANWRRPLLWEHEHEAFELMHGRRRRVFCASLADVFDNDVPEQWRADLFSLICQTQHLDWLLLTKRIGNAMAMLDRIAYLGTTDTVGELMPLPNVWLGATVINQEEADRDIPKLLAVPARVRFLSIEPMLGPMDLVPYIHCDVGNALDWVIAGGESGPKARPLHPNWVRSLRDQCASAGVPFHLKQHGEWLRGEVEVTPGDGCLAYVEEGYGITLGDGRRYATMEAHGAEFIKVGKHTAGRLLDGVEHSAFPAAD